MMCLDFLLFSFTNLNLKVFTNFVILLLLVKLLHPLTNRQYLSIQFLLPLSYHRIADTFLLIKVNHLHHLHFHRSFYYPNHLPHVHSYPGFLPHHIHHSHPTRPPHFHQSLLVHSPLRQYPIALSDCFNCTYYTVSTS